MGNVIKYFSLDCKYSNSIVIRNSTQMCMYVDAVVDTGGGGGII